MSSHDNVIAFRPRRQTMHVIRMGAGELAAPVDELRDLLAAIATHRISTAAKRVCWTEADGTTSRLTCRRLTAVLQELNVEFQTCCDGRWVPLHKAPMRVLSVFLGMAALCDWFAPGECGAWMRANNPPGNKVHAL
jgi:hypothetical protein